MTIARVAVSGIPYSVDKPYDYTVPQSLSDAVCAGLRVLVPFGRGNHTREGVILSVLKEQNRENLKEIEKLLDPEPLITPEQVKLALWMRERFFCTVYEAFRAMLPVGLWFKNGSRRAGDKCLKFACLAVSGEEAWEIAGVKRSKAPKQAEILELLASIGEASVAEITYFTGCGRGTVEALEKQGIIFFETREIFRRPEVSLREVSPIILNDEQEQAFSGLVKQLESGKASAALLYGVTGSGKTSVYIRLIEQALKLGKTAIVLVPEISLTPQLMSIFASYFENDVALLHSSLSIGERYDEWKRIKNGSVHVVIGTRSAIFAPLDNVGIIILDEEQEHTYKSESSPRYHARDVAKYLCVHSKAMLLLGSATPSIESMYWAKEGKYTLYTLTKRYNERKLPGIIPVDMKQEMKNGNRGDISRVLAGEISENLKKAEQTILFINRRGASSLILCSECGYTFECPRCSVHLTYHSANKRLMCHYCGYSVPEPHSCPKCGAALSYVGTGTQRVEEELRNLFPGEESVRMDLDTVSMTNSHEALLHRFSEEKIPFLLGTQMIAKGLDFGNVTLVGVLNADSGLYVNDYRARERTFSMITQVVGRAGRGEKKGRAVLQTYAPDNDLIALAGKQDYIGFYEEEIRLRRSISAPPFSTYYIVTCSGGDEAAVLRTCTKIREALGPLFRENGGRLLGPAPAPITRVNYRFHYRITVVCAGTQDDRERIGYVVRSVAQNKLSRGVLIVADAY